MFRSIRSIAGGVLIVAAVLLALLAVLGIWDIVEKLIFWNAIKTLSMLVFSTALIMIASMAAEHHPSLYSRGGHGSTAKHSVARVIIVIVLLLWLAPWLLSLMFRGW